MKTYLKIVLCACVAALAACHGSIRSLPATLGTPTPPPLLGAHRSFTLYSFRGGADGALPKGTLTLVQSGGSVMLYGRTAAGGDPATKCGTVFQTDLTGANYQVVHTFNGSDGCDPRHDAMVLINGLLYFTTQGVSNAGKTFSAGDIYSFAPGGSLTPVVSIVHAFAGGTSEGAEQHSSLTLDGMFGNVLFGQTAKGGAKDKGQIYAITPNGSQYYPIHDFHTSDGTEPHGRIIQLGNALWGIALGGGADGGGTVFSLVLSYVNGIPQPQPILNVIHDFAGGSDAYFSDHGYLAAVIEGGQTVLYGLTQCGGGGTGGDSHNCSGTGDGDGTIIRVVPNVSNGNYDGTATYSVFYRFQGFQNNDGASPYGSLYYDAASGYLYGTTGFGGSSDDAGTIFRFLPGVASSYQTIYHFTGKNGDGAKPIDNIIINNGIMYGMTVYGGSSDTAVDGSASGNGTIFAIPVP